MTNLKYRHVSAPATLALGCLLLTGVPFAAQAQSFSQPTFSGETTGAWSSPTVPFQETAVFSGVGTDEFIWGAPLPETAPANRLTFSGLTLTSVEPGALFELGALTYYNGTIQDGTQIDAVSLDLTLLLDAPVSVSRLFSINFDILTTVNTGDPIGDADAIAPRFQIGEQTFGFNGKEYTLGLVGFSQDGGTTVTEEFRVMEDSQATASLLGRIISPSNTATSTPEPGAIAGLSFFAVMLLIYHYTHRPSRL